MPIQSTHFEDHNAQIAMGLALWNPDIAVLQISTKYTDSNEKISWLAKNIVYSCMSGSLALCLHPYLSRTSHILIV